jgi:hypothetical protein
MLKKLSDFSDEQLAYFVKRVREIGSLGEEAALIETDKLLWEIGRTAPGAESEDAVDLAEARDELEELREELNELRADVTKGDELEVGEGESIQRRILYAGYNWSPATRRALEAEVAELQRQASGIAEEVEPAAHRQLVEECKAKTFYNTVSVEDLYRELRSAEEFFAKNGGVPADIARSIREAKERGAWFRARRKLNEAEIASAAGNARKAERLRKEAAAMLEQDWRHAFPGEPAPPI